MKSILYLFSLCILVAACWAANPDKDDDEYQKAYQFILQERYSDALEHMRQVLENHPQSRWADDAQFWQSFALEKTAQMLAQQGTLKEQEKKLKEAFESYEKLLHNYPDSKWFDDARTNLMQLSKELGAKGYTEFPALAQDSEGSEEEQIMEAAIQALQARGDEESLNALLRLYEKNPAPKIKEKIVYVIGTFDTPEARAKLTDIAKNDADTQVRLQAIFWLGQMGGDQSLLALKDLALTETEPKIQKKVIFSIAQMSGKASTDFLIDLAKNGQSEESRKMALFWLAQKEPTLEIFSLLRDTALNDPSQKIQERALFALSEYNAPQSEELLLQIARTHEKVELRKKSIFWLTQKNESSKEWADQLLDFIFNDPSPEVQEHAVFNLTQLDTNVHGQLLEIARTHSNQEIREKAVFWLGQIADSEQIISDLTAIALNDTVESIQHKALFSLAQSESDLAVDALIELSKNHPNLSIRKKAVFWLGQSDDERAVQAIEKILLQTEN